MLQSCIRQKLGTSSVKSLVVWAWYEKERWPQDFVRKDGIQNTRMSAEERSCREGV